MSRPCLKANNNPAEVTAEELFIGLYQPLTDHSSVRRAHLQNPDDPSACVIDVRYRPKYAYLSSQFRCVKEADVEPGSAVSDAYAANRVS